MDQKSKTPPPDPTPSGNVTMEMVARAAGVSMSTVSRVLTGTVPVSKDKRKAVKQAIADLNFVPSPMARGLARGRTMTIGVLTQAIDSPFYGVVHRGIEDELDNSGYMPLFVSGHWNATQERKCLDALRARRVDGIIMLAGRIADQTLIDCAKNLPTVAAGRNLQAPGLQSLNFDNFEGGRMATRFLIESGHKNIAFIEGEEDHGDAIERLRGYQSALEEAGIAYSPDLVIPGNFLETGGILAVDRLLENRVNFSAIFSTNDQMAYGALLSLRRHGLRVPDDISVVGFDDLLGSQYSNPPLTTVRQPAYELGRASASNLLSMLDGETPEVELPPLTLVVRESTRRLRG